MNIKHWFEIIEKFSSKQILVVGDIMMDRFVWGNVERISPEAPVPVVEVVKETEHSGGCGNVARNIVSLGGKCIVVSVIGSDAVGERLRQIMVNSNVDVSGIFREDNRPTIVKTRIIAHNQQMVRIDRESKSQISGSVLEKVEDFIKKTAKTVDAILISDYGKGMITKKLLKKCINLAHKYDIPISVDPKIEHFMDYKKVTVITPNTNEATLGMRLHKKPQTEEEVCALGEKIIKKLKSEAVVITRGEKGMSLFQKNKKVYNIPTRAREVYDVTGAGDTVIATLTLALSAGASMATGCEIANYAAGVVVGKVGTATVTAKELKDIIKEYAKNG
ncbi:MAG: D-glycero-beta-D-manno-heptose-7-phosphate kinase [Endomicrobiia bacterium]